MAMEIQDLAPDTRRRRRLREVLGQPRPAFVPPLEWAAALRWANDRRSLDEVAAELGLRRWPLKRVIDRVLGRMERASQAGALGGGDELAALPRRQAYLLRRAGLSTARAVAGASDARLLAITGIGPAAVAGIRTALASTAVSTAGVPARAAVAAEAARGGDIQANASTG